MNVNPVHADTDEVRAHRCVALLEGKRLVHQVPRYATGRGYAVCLLCGESVSHEIGTRGNDDLYTTEYHRETQFANPRLAWCVP